MQPSPSSPSAVRARCKRHRPLLSASFFSLSASCSEDAADSLRISTGRPALASASLSASTSSSAQSSSSCSPTSLSSSRRASSSFASSAMPAAVRSCEPPVLQQRVKRRAVTAAAGWCGQEEKEGRGDDADGELMVAFSHFSLSPAASASASSSVSASVSCSRVILRGRRSTPGAAASPPPAVFALQPVRSPLIEVLTAAAAPSLGLSASSRCEARNVCSPSSCIDAPLSPSLPVSASFLSQLQTMSSPSSSSSSSSFSSPSESPQLSLSASLALRSPLALQTPTSGSAGSASHHRPRLITPQQRAALFPSRSVSSSPQPLPGLSATATVSGSARAWRGKRPGGSQSPSSASALPSRAAVAGGREPGRGSKRMKEDRSFDRRCSFDVVEAADDGLLLLLTADDADDAQQRQPGFASTSLPRRRAFGSSSSLSSLDSPSSSGYSHAAAPLNSPVAGGGLRRRLCHIEQPDLLGAAAAAASVARRRSSLSLQAGDDEEGELVEAVGRLDIELRQRQQQQDDDDEEQQHPLPAARLVTRSSLRVNVAASQPLPPSDDDEQQPDTDAAPVSACASPLLSAGRLSASVSPSSSPPASSDFTSTCALSQAVRMQVQQRRLQLCPVPGSPEAVLLSPLSAVQPPLPDSRCTAAPPASPSLSPAASPSPPLVLLPSSRRALPRSLSMGVDPRCLQYSGAAAGGRPAGGSARRRREAELSLAAGEAAAAADGSTDIIVPFLKELQLSLSLRMASKRK